MGWRVEDPGLPEARRGLEGVVSASPVSVSGHTSSTKPGFAPVPVPAWMFIFRMRATW